MNKTMSFSAALLISFFLLCQKSFAQGVDGNFPWEDSVVRNFISLYLGVFALSIAPVALLMMTSFPLILTVFSILRQALGLQQIPPNMLLTSLALLLTAYIMYPVFQNSWSDGIEPYLQGSTSLSVAYEQSISPFSNFAQSRVDDATLYRFKQYLPALSEGSNTHEELVLFPAFVLSEVKRAFQIGFLIFLPFLVIDVLVAAFLMSVGMMMVPPAIISLPFKLAFFTLANGWELIISALIRSY